MSWQNLLTAHRVKRHKTSVREIEDLRALVARDLKDAALVALSSDRRFATAYNGMLQLGKMVVACAGYRVEGQGHHRTTIEAVELAMGSSISTLMAYFETCRRMRNTLDYDRAEVASESEAREILGQVLQFQQLVESWIDEHHTPYKP